MQFTDDGLSNLVMVAIAKIAPAIYWRAYEFRPHNLSICV